MTFPVIFRIGPLAIEAHLAFELLAYFAGYRFYLFLRRHQGDAVGDEQRTWVGIGAILGAAVGSKLLGLLEHPQFLTLSAENFAYLFASKTIVGGLLGGVAGVEIAKQRLGVSRSTGDLFCFPLILGMMIGRIGCFLAGPADGTWGDATDLFVGIDGGDGVRRHAMPLYEIALLAVLWLGLARLKRRTVLADGRVFQLFMAGYLAWRLAAEFIKPVDIVAPLGLSAIQIACAAGLIYYGRLLLLTPRPLTSGT